MAFSDVEANCRAVQSRYLHACLPGKPRGGPARATTQIQNTAAFCHSSQFSQVVEFALSGVTQLPEIAIPQRLFANHLMGVAAAQRPIERIKIGTDVLGALQVVQLPGLDRIRAGNSTCFSPAATKFLA